MKKLIIFLIGTMIFVTGCGETSSSTVKNELNTNYENNKVIEVIEEIETEKIFELSDDGILMKISGNVRFVPIEKESIYLNYEYLYMYTIVDLETGIMYLYTEKEVSGVEARGFGTTFTMLMNSDGTPCVCEKLNALREFYEYEVE